MKGRDQLCEKPGTLQLTASDGYFSCQLSGFVLHIFHGFFRQRYDFLGAAAQQHAVFGQYDTVFAPLEQLYAQLFFQLDHLP